MKDIIGSVACGGSDIHSSLYLSLSHQMGEPQISWIFRGLDSHIQNAVNPQIPTE